MKLIILFFFLLFSKFVWAYPHYIGHGYPSCMNCHYNPFGGGTVNDYGRAVSATALSADHLYPSSWDNEKTAYHSGFLFRPPTQKWVRTQINYRGFNIIRNPGSGDVEKKEWITMQLDGRAVLKFGERDQLLFSAGLSYTPKPASPGPGVKDESDIRSREYYVGFRPTPSFGVYAGLMDKVYGIRIVEHIAYSRTYPQVTQNDQTHGVAFHYLTSEWEAGAHVFLGNLGQEEDIRMKGASLQVEKTFGSIHRIGGSVMKSENEYLSLMAYSGQLRMSLKDGASFQGEFGQVHKQSANGLVDVVSRYGLLQTYLKPFRGVYFLTNVEYIKSDIESEEYTVRWGPALQYMPIQRTEFRLDLYNTRNFNPKTSVKDTWLLLLQTHFWL